MQNTSLESLIPEAERDFSACANINDLEQAKAKYLGKSGSLTEAMKSLGKLSNEERPAAGAAINVVKQAVDDDGHRLRGQLCEPRQVSLGDGTCMTDGAQHRALIELAHARVVRPTHGFHNKITPLQNMALP